MRALASILVLLAARGVVDAGELCGPDRRGVSRYRGAVLDLDVKGADLHDVFRLLSDVGRVNIVLPDAVTGKVTMRLKRVPWDQAACTIAAVHQLVIEVDGNVLLVTRREPPRPAR